MRLCFTLSYLLSQLNFQYIEPFLRKNENFPCFLVIFTMSEEDNKSQKTFCIFTVDFFSAERLVAEQSVVVADQKRTLTQLEERRENTLTQLDRIQQDILQVLIIGVGQNTENGKERHAIAELSTLTHRQI